jgi:effector-binding domain-containing protein
MATEEAKYATMERDDNFELRQYKPQVVAETIVKGDFAEAGNLAFDRLFQYINGANRSRQSIAMTAPVAQEARSENITMTAPVGQEKTPGGWSVSFMMPADYKLETLPEPNDSAVKLRAVPGRLMASVRYSGRWTAKLYDLHAAQLREWIKEKKLKIVGEEVWARYNPPFTLWFLRRNEILIPVEQPSPNS